MTLGEMAYNGYGDSTGWKTWNGLPMGQWEDMGPSIKQAWEDAAKRIAYPLQLKIETLNADIMMLQKEVEENEKLIAVMKNTPTQNISESLKPVMRKKP